MRWLSKTIATFLMIFWAPMSILYIIKLKVFVFISGCIGPSPIMLTNDNGHSIHAGPKTGPEFLSILTNESRMVIIF